MTPGPRIEPGDTLVEGERSHHYANPAPLKIYCLKKLEAHKPCLLIRTEGNEGNEM